ncbi:baculoviral IAP repeat-containing protein 2 isoform X3 [Anolis carolinensis]|uniref:baculoviral IAP repeat-containing protein 2 isoform X3 n=1 Tax=Anolis carolinensis TaxID=28377 RepID=UPI000462AD1B|nr:PREDICTED: baculoviral IAP repeat-containing protein 2 isoform X3 [Anolis carolinensis]|eukprot:XP_008106262.1 PREDICTED: baculoviral IAP repeat-containing protein 2 isoform X3 [Anolis carolinensis]
MNTFDTFAAKLKNVPDVGQLKYDLSCELFRMSTFSTFPLHVPVSERSLARAGFYYTGVKDKVKCYSCGLMLDNWKKGDNPLDKHKQLYPSCSVVQNLTSLNNLGSSFYSAFSPPSLSVGHSSSHSPQQTPNLDQVGYFSGSFSSVPQELPKLTEGISHVRPKVANSAMSSEEARLLTFKTWPLTFLSPSSLAKAGFYYIGPADKVACFVCGGHLGNWEPKDNAMSEHRRHFPTCPFVEQTQSQPGFTVSNLSMQTYRARVGTFENWPMTVPVLPQRLADAGFYYVGRNDDVKCFCCDGGLRCWESGDDPWEEHAKWFPRCEYLIHRKGQEFVRCVQARFPHLLEQLLSTSDIPVDENTSPPIVIRFEPGENGSEDEVIMKTPVVEAALEMGFRRRLVKQIVQSKILRTGESYKSINDLVSDLIAADDEKRDDEKEPQMEESTSDLSLIRKNRVALFQRLTCVLPILECLLASKAISSLEYQVIKQKTQTPLQARELIDTILVKGNKAANIFRNCIQESDPVLYQDLFVEKNMTYIPADVSGLSMEEQLRRLQEERTCKVCMDKEVSIVFIPCGHLVVCKECAPSLRKCPICRGTIKGTVRTFLS